MKIDRKPTQVLKFVVLGIGILQVGRFGLGLMTGQPAKKQAHAAAESLRKIPAPSTYKLGNIYWEKTNDGISSPWAVTFPVAWSTTASDAQECGTFIAYARRLGASSLFDEDPHQSEASDKLQMFCVNATGDTFTAYGTYAEGGKESRTKVEFHRHCKDEVDSPKKCRYQGNVAVAIGNHDFDPNITENMPGFQPSPVLEAIGGYRIKHPHEDPYSAKTIDNALRSLRARDPKTYIMNVANKDGDITVLEVGRSWGPMCLSIKVFDPSDFGVPDPGAGYVVGYVNGELTDTSPFGRASSGACPKS